MTLKESMTLYCMEHKQCDQCPIGMVCEKFHNEDDPYETIGDMDDDFVKVIAYDARRIAEKILFHLNCCEPKEEDCPS